MRRCRVVYGNPKRFYIDDVEVTKAEFDKAFPTKIEDILASGLLNEDSHRSACWPMTGSVAAAIDPSQVEAVMERDRARGVPTDYVLCRDGASAMPVFRDRGHRKAYLKSHGHYDRDGGYGD